MTDTVRPNIFPILRYKDCHAAIDWLARAFGFQKQAEYAGSDGGVAHAELRFGTAAIGLSSVGRIDPANPWSSVRQGVYVLVPEIDAHHDRAKAAGADIVVPLRNTDYGAREYSARDLDGHLWGFGTYDMGVTAGEPIMFPGVLYRDGRAALRWLADAFGFEQTFQVSGPNGSLLHGEMRFGDGTIFLELMSDDATIWGDRTQVVHVYLDDPDTHHARAEAAGATIVKGPESTAYGARWYLARDPEGFLWGFSTYKPAAAARM